MLEQEQIALLTPEQASSLRDLELLFASPGWKIFIEEVTEHAQVAQYLALNANDWPENRIQTGRLRVLEGLLKYEDQKSNEFLNQYEERMAAVTDEELEAELDYE
jgi:hypothetical protein